MPQWNVLDIATLRLWVVLTDTDKKKSKTLYKYTTKIYGAHIKFMGLIFFPPHRPQ